MRLEGRLPLLMHNARLADPLDEIAKKIAEVSGKKTKTEADHQELAHLQWLGGIYFSHEIGPFVPAPNLLRCLVEGGRFSKHGKQIERGLLLDEIMVPLGYEGPRDLVNLYTDKQFVHRGSVKISQARVIRTRPQFPRWWLEVAGAFDDALLNESHLRTAAEMAGSWVGLGDWRPTYGRFTSKIEMIA